MLLNERTALAVFIDVVILLIVIINSVLIINNNNRWNNKLNLWVNVLIICFCVFGFWDTDFYGLYQSLDAYNLDFHQNLFAQLVNVHVEPFHFIVYQILGRNYILYRLVLFGVGYLFFYLSAKSFDCQGSLPTALFCLIYLWVFSYSRVSFGVASFFFGLILIVNHKNSGHIVGGIVCLVLSYFVHKSMVILFPLIIPSLLRFNRTRWILALLSVAVVYVAISVDFLDVIFSYETDNDSLNQTLSYGGYYLEGVSGISGFHGLLKLSQFISVVLLFLCVITRHKELNQKEMPYSISVLFNYVVWLFIVMVILLLRTSLFSAIFYRVMNMIYVPIILLMTIFFVSYSCKIRSIDRISIALSTILSVATVSYQYYCIM